MARFAFGGEITQLVVTPDASNANALVVAPNTAIVFKVAIDGATATDFLLWDGSAYTTVVSSISSNAAGILPRFQGPDGLKYLYSQAADGSWVRLTANDLEASLGSATDGQYLKKVSGAVVGVTLTADDVADGTTNKAFLATERSKLAGVAAGATVNDTDVNLKSRANHTGTVNLATMATDEADVARKAGSIKQFADVDDAAPAAGQALVWDSSAGIYIPSELSLAYAGLGPDGRLEPTRNPRFYMPTVIIDEGGTPPVGFPSGGLVFARPVTATVVPVRCGSNFSQGPATVAVTTTAAIAVGDQIIIAVASSAEATLPTTYTVTYATGAGSVASVITGSISSTSQVNILTGRCTTAIPSGTVITITANQARAHLMATIDKAANIVTSGAVDATVTSGGNSTSTLSKVVGPSAATVQANELAIMAVAINSGGPTPTRSVGGTNGWAATGANVVSTAAGGGRSMGTFYKVLNATGAVSGNVDIVASDGTSGAWVGALATLKAA